MDKVISTNPGKNYEVVGEIEITSNEEIIEKVENANKIKEDWRRLGVANRVELLRKAQDLFRTYADEIATLISKEIGTPITECKGEVEWDFGYFQWFLDNAEKYLTPEVTYEDEKNLYTQYFEPIGTAAVITPWNLPFDMFLWGVIPNLLVGNTVVYKASRECALSGKLFEDIMNQVGLPSGVFSAIHGTSQQGEFLVQQPVDLIWFTGSSEIGKHLFEMAGKKFIKSVMEMGGSNPAIIFDDADIDGLIPTIMFKRYAYVGQACDAVKRLIVHESILGEVVEKLEIKIKGLTQGDPEDKMTQIGPVVSQKQLETLMSQVDESVAMGANVVVGGGQPRGLQGAYYLPTLLTNVTRQMPVWKEEVFGPVLPIVTFSTEEEAISLANDSQYGLGSQVYTKDREKAHRVAGEIKAGSVDINGTGHFKPFNPFGGYKNSGMGREHGRIGFQELCQIKVLSETK